ncbi:hypothetical protein R5R35_004086 [Gryllus longicercus]|uniref:Uncharacterized protein n=1 Tax=Gryllus longicercus TaxID=2509291 RepID=A0AAN9VJ91_9ORTH
MCAADVDAEVVLMTEEEERDGESFLALKELQVLVQEVRQASVRLDNLFGGDPMLGEVVNAAVNAHFPKVLQELRPALQHSLQDALRDLVAKILASYPTRLLFPED